MTSDPGQDGPGWIVGRSGASQPQEAIEKQEQAAATTEDDAKLRAADALRSSSSSVQHFMDLASSIMFEFCDESGQVLRSRNDVDATCIMRAATSAERDSERERKEQALPNGCFFLSRWGMA